MLHKWNSLSEKENQGVALILVVITLSIMLLMGLAVATTSTTEVTTSQSAVLEINAHYLAEAGLNQAVAMIRSIQNGNLNDVLAGPDGQCTAPCNWASWSGTHPLSVHGNELVVDTSAAGNGSATAWAKVAVAGQVLPNSGQTLPLFSPGVVGFMQADPTKSIKDGGDGAPATYVQGSGAWSKTSLYPDPGTGTVCGTSSSCTLNWAGKRETLDPVTQTKYVTLVEVYDDDDPLSLEFNAYNNGIVYPSGYTGTSAKIYGTNTHTTGAPNCVLGGTGSFECPGTGDSKSFGNKNQDFNNRIYVRATGRVIKKFGSDWRLMSESVVDAIVGFFPYPAVLTGNCLRYFGNAKIIGAYGSLFANSNICVGGGSTEVSQTVGTAANICGGTIGGTTAISQNQPPIFIPDFKPIPDRISAPYDDGPQAAPYANPTLTLSGPGGGVPLQYSQSTTGIDRIYPGDFWLRQIARINQYTPTGSGTLNETSGNEAAGYILLQPRGTSGSRRTCVNGGSCSGSENGILARLGITEADLDALDNRVDNLSSDMTAPGNSDAGFDPTKALIIRLRLKRNVTFPTATGTIPVDAIDRDRIFVASITNGGVPTTVSSTGSATNKPKSLGGTTTYEFYRIIPGAATILGVNTPFLGTTLSSINAGSPSYQSTNSGSSSYGDTGHGWSFDGGSFIPGSCSGTASAACSSAPCNTCPPYTDTQCTNPYGGEWTTNPGDSLLRGYCYFIDGNFRQTGIGGNPPIRATLIATGHLNTTGNNEWTPIMKAALSPLQPPFTNPTIQFLFGADIDFGGNVADGVNFEGLAYAREQIEASGSGTYNGQIIAADKSNIDNDVQNNSIGGNYTVNFNQAQNVLGTLNLSSWRKLKF
ncbi:MAG: hypothetical protein AB1489_01560 [Acidobacteriota bacterium]